MLLTMMELSGGEYQDPGPNGQPGRKSGELVFTMRFQATSEDEIPAMVREFNNGTPTAAFWEGIEYGYVKEGGSVDVSPIAVSVKQSGSPGPKTTVAVQPGAPTMVSIPVTVIGPDGTLGGHVPLEVEARPC